MTTLKNSAKAPLITATGLLTLLAIQAVFATDDGIYKSIGADGTVIFTDKPRESTVAVEAREPAPVSRSTTPHGNSIRPDEFSSDALGGYSQQAINISALQITSPSNNQTFSDLQAPIPLTIAMGPDKNLPDGHTAEIRMNGKVVSNSRLTQTSAPIPDPGTHVFEARIINSNGVVLVQSKPVKVNVE